MPRRPHQAARWIKEALGDPEYRSILRDIFGPPDANAEPCIAIHSLLLRMPFQAYVTTNYDSRVLAARSELYPAIPAGNYATWKDRTALAPRLTDDAFRHDTRPILFAHGIYKDPDSIVLSIDDYRRAYAPAVYREVFDNLWGQGHLVFVGFGSSDWWLDYVADEILRAYPKNS